MKTRKRGKKEEKGGSDRPDPRPGVSEKDKVEGAFWELLRRTENGKASWLGKEQGFGPANFVLQWGKAGRSSPAAWN